MIQEKLSALERNIKSSKHEKMLLFMLLSKSKRIRNADLWLLIDIEVQQW
jgi:hypothetical protein